MRGPPPCVQRPGAAGPPGTRSAPSALPRLTPGGSGRRCGVPGPGRCVRLHLTTFCLQHKPTVIACVCIHLACKWSNWEIPVSMDGKHWWEYLDRTVTLQLLDELTHEFLQILEKTPSRLKRIRNWRATQAAKKPKTEGGSVDSAFLGPSSLDSLSAVAGSFFPSTSSSDPGDMPSLDPMGGPFGPYQPLDDPPKACGYEPFPPQTSHSDYKHEHKAGGAGAGASSGGKGQPLAANPLPFARPQKVLTLDKYREKHAAAELAMQNGRVEEPGGDLYPPGPSLTTASSHHHKKRSQPQGSAQVGEGRREKSSSKKSRLAPAPAPPPSSSAFAENGVGGSGEELKMRIKVSSERLLVSEQGAAAAVPGKDKHKDHSGHRHPKHGSHSSHAYSLGGGVRGGGMDGGNAPALTLRVPGGGGHDGGSSGSSRKRAHPDAGTHNNNNHHHHHHHSSKSSRSSKGGPLGSAHYAADGGPRAVERLAHDGANGVLNANGQHTDYKDTFDMLDSLLSAQGMNL
ncbi:Cyclin-T2 [Merluccius polli]|uniref:Cyclin-T2 n=1 Tax=Merluccius polli TaxID=89951 RepID=A0AA47N964_MERPO|nr:Cyclin-T2 [Merluccius polli]